MLDKINRWFAWIIGEIALNLQCYNAIAMKIKHCVTLLFLFALMSPYAMSAERSMTLADSIMADTTFVLRGVMSKKWNGVIKFAVSDPIKNKSHELRAAGNGRFEMTVPMRGMIQNMYLYVGDAVTVPVCAGDTINIIFEDDDMRLTARDPKAQLDLQLAEIIYNKMRKRYLDINRTYNSYNDKSGYKRLKTVESDSIFALVMSKTDYYHERYKNIVDTFIANHGTPRLEEYFRCEGYYGSLRFLAYGNGDMKVTRGAYMSEMRNNIPFNFYQESLMKYPEYAAFMLYYLGQVTERVSCTFLRRGDYHDKVQHAMDVSRLISPSRFLNELSEVRMIDANMLLGVDDNYRKHMIYVYDNLHTAALRREMERRMAEVDRLASGQPAPTLVMKDSDGRKYTLDDFKGKYVYLDFWDFGCSHCITEFGVVPRLREYYAGRMDNVEIITVCASDASKSKLEKFVEKHKMNERNLILDARSSDSVYNITSFPTYILIDPQGRIVEFYTDRPSVILFKADAGVATTFDKALTPK